MITTAFLNQLHGAAGALPSALLTERDSMAAQWLRVLPNVGVKLTAEADGDWPRKDNLHCGLERPGDGCRSGSG